MRKTVLELNYGEARSFFLKEDSFINFDLPQYFCFSKILKEISDKLEKNPLNLKDVKKAKEYEDINHILFSNKGGKYAWRKYQIIHPVLYVFLVHQITEEKNWKMIKERFKKLQNNPFIKCTSMPVVTTHGKTQRGIQIEHWLDTVEEESIKLGLDFEYLFNTDITDCYGSIYTHSVAWALHTKSFCKERSNRKNDKIVGNIIDHTLQSMSYGQTNGIPQGSLLMDFIAEIVLASIDNDISERLKEYFKIKSYHIIRYRDDYRIFVNNLKDGEEILKILSEKLADYGMRLNMSKTIASNDIIVGSIKPDKLHYLRLPIPKKLTKNELRNQLLLILQTNQLYPNGGTTNTRLSKILKILSDKNIPDDSTETISILINIVLDSPRSIPIVSAIISKLLTTFSQDKKSYISKKIKRKISLIPNSGLLEIWLQRILIKLNIENEYQEKLCKIASNEKINLFNVEWISNNELKNIASRCCVDKNIIKSLDAIINKQEVNLFKYYVES